MPDSNVARLLETLARELGLAIQGAGLADAKVVRSDTPPSAERRKLQWYCGKAASDSVGHLFLGALPETWEAIGGTQESWFGRCVEKALAGYPDAKHLVANTESSDAPPNDWPRIAWEIARVDDTPLALYSVFSPALEAAVAPVEDSPATIPSAFPAGLHAADLLAQVHVPVSVSFGGTQIRMKDLFNLSTGSVVELDQSLSDSVEIRANNCLIARGEVVAIDGNYGVRVLELVSSPGSAAKGIKL